MADPGPELMFDDRLYKRGALALHALRRRVGDEVFFPMIQSWLAQHTGGSVTTEMFEAHVARGRLGDADQDAAQGALAAARRADHGDGLAGPRRSANHSLRCAFYARSRMGGAW